MFTKSRGPAQFQVWLLPLATTPLQSVSRTAASAPEGAVEVQGAASWERGALFFLPCFDCQEGDNPNDEKATGQRPQVAAGPEVQARNAGSESAPTRGDYCFVARFGQSPRSLRLAKELSEKHGKVKTSASSRTADRLNTDLAKRSEPALLTPD